MKILFLLFLATMLQAETPKPPLVCTPAGVKKPPLAMPVDGKCSTGYQPMKDKEGKTVMYCVNTEHRKPAECKTATILPPSQAPKQ